jgi:PAS domain S-box-containing protein
MSEPRVGSNPITGAADRGVAATGNVIGLAVAAIVAIAATVWWGQAQVQQQMRAELGEFLSAIVSGREKALDFWYQERINEVQSWASSPRIRDVARDLLATPRQPSDLINAPAQAAARILLASVLEERQYRGYFIIAADNVNLASSRDGNIGVPNLLPEAFLRQVRAGNAAISLPQVSDVPLRDRQGRLHVNAPTMFSAAPILDDNGAVIAVFTLRIDPVADFAEIFRIGQIGETGHTYAFDGRGHMISESRFDRALRELGVLPQEARSILNLEIRDPGGDITAGYRPDATVSERPLTHAAAAAIDGYPGQNLTGYRDFRGIPVYGAWRWYAPLGIGIATEMTAAEAGGPVRTARLFAVIAGLFVVGLVAGLAAIYLVNRRRLVQSHNNLLQVFKTVADPLIIIDERGTALLVNPACEQIFGYTADEIIGQNIKQLMPEPDRSQHDRYLENFRTTRRAKIIGIGREVSGRRRNGEVFPLDLAVTEARLGKRSVFIGLCRDITARKAAERNLRDRTAQLEAANAELDAFAYSVSHDLRAPLRSLDGFSQALIEEYADKLDGEALDYLGRIRRASQRMAQMIDDILNLSRATRGEMRFIEVCLSDLVATRLGELQEQEPARKARLKIAEDVTARCDPRLINIVLDNLLNNAWKFTGKRDTAEIEFGSDGVNGTTAYFVRDNGAGFDMQYADKLFGIFQRLHSANEFEGTGVGLATVARLIRRHGGQIWAESGVDKGTTFYFTLGH